MGAYVSRVISSGILIFYAFAEIISPWKKATGRWWGRDTRTREVTEDHEEMRKYEQITHAVEMKKEEKEKHALKLGVGNCRTMVRSNESSESRCWYVCFFISIPLVVIVVVAAAIAEALPAYVEGLLIRKRVTTSSTRRVYISKSNGFFLYYTLHAN